MSPLTPEPHMVLRLDHPVTTLLAWQARRLGVPPGLYVQLILANHAARCPMLPECPLGCEIHHCPAHVYAGVSDAFDVPGALQRFLNRSIRTQGDPDDATS